MKRMLMLLAVAAAMVSASGCGCCGWCLPKAQPVVAAYPAQPACDPCATAPPVTYGYPPAATTYTPAPSW